MGLQVLLLVLLIAPGVACQMVNVTFPSATTRFSCSIGCERKECVENVGCKINSFDQFSQNDASYNCSNKMCQADCKSLPACTVSPENSALQLLPFGFTDGRALSARWMTEDAVKLWDAASGKAASFRSFFCLRVSTILGHKPGQGLAFLIAASGKAHIGNDGMEMAVKFNTQSAMNRSIPLEIYDSSRTSTGGVGVAIGLAASVWLNESVLGSEFLNRTFGVWVEYNAEAQVMDVNMLQLPDLAPSAFAAACSSLRYSAKRVLSYAVNLRSSVNEYSYIGFAAEASRSAGINEIFYWHFQTIGDIEGYEGHNHGPAEGPAAAAGGRHSLSGQTVTAVVVGVLLVVIAIVGCASFFLWLQGNRRKIQSAAQKSGRMRSSRPFVPTFSTDQGAPRKFSYSELRQATDNFSSENLLGEGGFGEVFKGVLRDKSTWVAVKRIAGKSRQGEKQFLAEVTIIGRLRHRNLVPLRGWCHNKRGGELLLVYDYMPNSSLDQHVLPPSRYVASRSDSKERNGSSRPVLGWAVRYHVIKGVAAALLYLHEEWEEVGLKSSVIHRDIKSSNILLDAEWNARLGDFGLALLVERDKSAESVSSVAGTRGYLAPEYAYTGKVSVQADIYSFGVVMLEVASGRRPIDWFRPENERFLVQWVCCLHESGELRAAADPELGGEFQHGELLLILRLGLLCTLNDPADRPSMRQVVDYLAVGDSGCIVLPNSILAYREHLARSVPSPSRTSCSLTTGGDTASKEERQR